MAHNKGQQSRQPTRRLACGLAVAQLYQSSFKSLVGTAYRIRKACQQLGWKKSHSLSNFQSAKPYLDDGTDRGNKKTRTPFVGCPAVKIYDRILIKY